MMKYGLGLQTTKEADMYMILWIGELDYSMLNKKKKKDS